MLRALRCREDTIMNVLNRFSEFDPDAYAQELQRRSIELITIEGAEYPRLLKEIPDAPIFLYARGDLSILVGPCLALVGTRAMTPYGKRVTEEFVSPLVQAGVVTVSGLAQGIDTQVAIETLAAQGKTVAVLGHGMAKISPQARARLADRIVAEGGLILSEFPLDGAPDKYTFPARNRIIAGLSLGTVVLEAGEGSGALITADLALDYGRDIFVVPGAIFSDSSVGCHQFIAQGRAKLVSAPQQVLSDVGIVVPKKSVSLFTPGDPQEKAVFGVLTTMPQPMEDLVALCGLKAAAVNATLTMFGSLLPSLLAAYFPGA